MRKLSCKNLLVWLTGLAVLSATAIGFVVSSNVQSKTNTFVKNATTIFTSKNIGNKVGTIRHWQNNNFSGIEVKNGGFVALTGTNSATRIDAFGNIIWEFNPSSLSSSGYQNVGDFSAKKVVEVAQDEGNANVLYLLLVPTSAPNSNAGTDAADEHYYNDMKSDVLKQATIVQITENLTSYSGSTWTPSFTINNHININPEKMVNNYPSSWKTPANSTAFTTSSNNGPTFFSKTDHPSWYVTSSGDKVSSASESSKSKTTQEKTVTGTTMVLPWKQYITNLGNMYAKNGVVLIFGGNGTIFNDPEALSIGVWKADFNTTNENKIAGIPYAYILKGMKYAPNGTNSGTSNLAKRWNQCYAPIGQTNDFNYVPRLAVAGIQTNISNTSTPFLYLAGGITVGQIANSQTRNDGKIIANDTTTTKLQDKRSLQLTGQNIVSSTINKPDRNSIDPCLLFGTALSIDKLLNMPSDANKDILQSPSHFDNILVNNNYFDIGATVGTSSALGTYYFFNNQTKREHSIGSTYWRVSTTGLERKNFKWDDANVKVEVQTPKTKQGDTTTFQDGTYQIDSEGTKHEASNISASYNLSLLVENAKNYYYPTLAFGYSLKSVSSLTKVKMKSTVDTNKTLYGYAMQVGKSILYINEPKFDTESIVYHGPSTVSIGDNNTFGTAKYGDMSGNVYYYGWNNWDGASDKNTESTSRQPKAFSSCGNYIYDNAILSMGIANFVGGIKDLNETVEVIANGFKISEDPYGTNSAKTTKPDATLPWTNFKGLSSANDGSSVSSIWSSTSTTSVSNTSNTGDQMIWTNNPQLTEYSANDKKNEWYFSVDKTNLDSSIKVSEKGSKQVWFEDVSTKHGYTTIQPVSNFVGIDKTLQSINNYYLSGYNTDNKKFDVVLDNRSDSNNPNCMFGQLKSTNTTNVGISYSWVQVGSFNELKYTVQDQINKTDLLTQGNFVSSLPESLALNFNQLLDEVAISEITGDPTYTKKIKIVKSQYVNSFFSTLKLPHEKIQKNSRPRYNNQWIILVASNINEETLVATYTAYTWNALIEQYEFMPLIGNNSSVNVNNLTTALPKVESPVVPPIVDDNNQVTQSETSSWVLPVSIGVPIGVILIGVIIVLGVLLARNKR